MFFIPVVVNFKTYEKLISKYGKQNETTHINDLLTDINWFYSILEKKRFDEKTTVKYTSPHSIKDLTNTIPKKFKFCGKRLSEHNINK